MGTPEACKQGVTSNTFVILAYLSFPCEKLPSISKSLRTDNLEHRGNRFFGTDNAFNFPSNRYIGHISRDLLMDVDNIAMASTHVATSPGCIAKIDVLLFFLCSSTAMCRSIWLRAALEAAYAANL